MRRRRRFCANFRFRFGPGQRRRGRPDPLRLGPGELIRKRRQPRGPGSTCHREAEVETERERKQVMCVVGESPARLRAIIKMGPRGRLPSTALTCCALRSGPQSPLCPPCPPAPLSMRPPRSEYPAPRAPLGRGAPGQRRQDPGSAPGEAANQQPFPVREERRAGGSGAGDLIACFPRAR